MFERGQKYLLYDGDCGFCERCVEIARRLNARDEFVIAPHQQFSDAQLQAAGLSRRRCHRELQAINEAGRTFGGAFALNYFAGHFFPFSLLVKIAQALPVLILIEVVLYRLTAVNRGVFSRWTGGRACAVNFSQRKPK